MEIIVRPETADDMEAITHVNQVAFARPDEAMLINTLRQTNLFKSALSLVAMADQAQVIGHILFTPVTVDGSPVSMMALGPMAVLPDYQGRGVGSGLIYQGLEMLRKQKTSAVVVLGHPEYYPRFGFVPASQSGLSCKWAVPDEVFMVQELKMNALQTINGQIDYHPAFDAV